MSDVAIYGSAIMALAALVSQLIAAWVPPISYKALLLLRLPLFVITVFVDALGLLLAMFTNYCESNCHAQPLNGPTAFIAVALMSVNVLFIWLSWRAIPRAAQRSGRSEA